ncbi:hypothetical protein D3C81_212890 [compost metagenome]
MPSTNDVFQKNIDDIALILIRKFGLRFKREEEKLSCPLDRWLDFRCRYIAPLPRKIALSNAFPKASLPPSAQRGLSSLLRKFTTGENVNPYQGRGLIIRNDTSGSKKHARTDLLYADWNMLHFHLSDEIIPSGQFFSKPADYLAFCMIGGDVVAVVDVLPHPDRAGFANTDLFATLANSWPQYIAQYELNGILAGNTFSSSDISQLREAGVTTFIEHDGKVYMGPGGGITSAGTSLRVGRSSDYLRDTADMLANMVDDPHGQFQMHPVIKEISEPDFMLALDCRGLCVRENTSQIHFLIKRPVANQEPTRFEAMSDMLVPEWAIS